MTNLDSGLITPVTQAFELKGRMMTLSVLRVLTCELEALGRQLDVTIASAPALFQSFPVLLDFESLSHDAQRSFDIARLDRMLRERGMLPVGLRAASDVLTGVAAGVGIGVMAASAEPARRERATGAANLLIRQPVRSGQQLYAEGGDLIVLATVSPGAELLADGNIHVYGALRGRALAGVRGNADARIFCQRLDAQLISVAGHYRVSDNIAEAQRRHPVQVYLEGEELRIEPL
jgi:septum site-determining protein MinC